MRPIPASLLAKLRDRFKSVELDNNPQIRLVATQVSTNTFLTEPIHTNTPANFGDVTVRQLAGESEPSLAYAICVDNGFARVYSRLFPASMDNPWSFVFQVGTASEVAIEYDGLWQMDDTRAWYYLQTEQYPWVFYVQQGILYAQKWRNSADRIQLASGVSQISAIRGWASSIIPQDDQGLIVAYLKNGAVYYRNYAWSDVAGEQVWSNETSVSFLGNDNVYLSLCRTNDFRVGFVCEDADGDITIALTSRTYAGMSVRPEGVYAGISATSFSFCPINFRTNTVRAETATATVGDTMLLFDGTATDRRIAVTSVTRTYDDENTYCTGCTVALSCPIENSTLPEAFVQGITETAPYVSIDTAEYNSGTQSVDIVFDWGDHEQTKLADPFTVTLPACDTVTYTTDNGQRWFFDRSISGTSVATYNQITNTAKSETVTAEIASTTVSLLPVAFRNGYSSEAVLCSVGSTAFQYIPVGDIPV